MDCKAGLRSIFNLVLVGGVAIAALSGCGGAAATTASTTATPPTATEAPTPSPTADITAISSAYLTAYNLLQNTLNPLINQQNSASIGSTALTNALNAQIAAYQAFDTSVSGMDASAFPSTAQDLRAVNAADAAVEAGYGNLVANSSNVNNYNGVFASLTTAQAQFTSANALVFKDLSLVIATPTP